MKFSNPLTKIRRLVSKRKSITKIQTERKIPKAPISLRIIKFLIILVLILITTILIYFAIPNIKAINDFSPKSFGKDAPSSKSNSFNILLVIKDNKDGYELLKSLDLISYDKSTKDIKLKAINTKTTIKDSQFGKNSYVENIYQLNKLNGGKDLDLLLYFEDQIAVKLDYYMVIPMDYFRESIKVTGPVKFFNEFVTTGFSRGNIAINEDNISTFWDSEFSNDGQRLVGQNKFLQGYFSKIGAIDSLYYYSKLSELSQKYIDTNMSLDVFRNFTRELIFNNSSIDFGFSPTNLFLSMPDGKYWEKNKFDDFLKNEFSSTKIQREQARVEVQNASGTQGLASKIARFVSNAGTQVSRVGNFGVEVPVTTVYVKDRNKFAETVNFLENLLTNAEFRFESPEKLSTADILIIVKEF